jgi:hypothetical protein
MNTFLGFLLLLIGQAVASGIGDQAQSQLARVSVTGWLTSPYLWLFIAGNFFGKLVLQTAILGSLNLPATFFVTGLPVALIVVYAIAGQVPLKAHDPIALAMFASIIGLSFAFSLYVGGYRLPNS